ncbi:MAG TPA: hypothetical protein VF798_13930 [Burkholderiaceae bacterium]
MKGKQTKSNDDDLSMWVVYEEPPGFPDQYVARRYVLEKDTGDYVVGDTLNDVRAKLPPGLMRLERSPQDDPQVRESWI